jgi:hypothetical protein
MSYSQYSNTNLYPNIYNGANINNYLIKDVDFSGNLLSNLGYINTGYIQNDAYKLYSGARNLGNLMKPRKYINNTYSIDAAYGEDKHMHFSL